MTSVGHDIVVMNAFHALIRHRGHHDGCACGAGNAYPSGAPDFTSVFMEVHVVLSPCFMLQSCLLSF